MVAVCSVPAVAAAQDRVILEGVRNWLLNACGVGEGTTLSLELSTLGDGVIPLLVDSYRDGPDVADVVAVGSSSRLQFARIRDLLERGVSIGLSEDDLADVRSMTEAEYVGQAESDFDFQYRSEALRGLAELGGPVASELLQAVAADRASPFAATALLLLERR